jgi:Amt family ammonium transporter
VPAMPTPACSTAVVSEQLGVQALGVGAGFAWAFVTGLILFLGIKYTVGLRVSADEERRGLDIGEHGMEAYSGFQIFVTE